MKMKFAENLKIWSLISLAIIVIGLVVALTSGLNQGIDFTGGTMIHIDMNKTYEVSQIKDSISAYNLDEDIIHAGFDKTEIIIKTNLSLDNAQRMEIFETLKNDFNLTDKDFLEAEQFGPTVGKEIQTKALTSILIASLGMLIYITLRFEIIYGITAIVALIHDVLILLAVYSIFNIPINSSFIAAVLTIVGYSINDTIVVFDRVRVNVRKMRKNSYAEIANKSLSQTIVRSINTSFTTLLVIGSLYFWGVDSIKEFAFPLMSGIIVGTYSSIFIASPLWAFIKDKNKKVNYKKA